MIGGGSGLRIALLLFAGACSSQSPSTAESPTPQPPPEVIAPETTPPLVTTSPPVATPDAMGKDHCTAAIPQAISLVRDSAASSPRRAQAYEIVPAQDTDFDFNGDGRSDCVLRYHGRLNDLFAVSDTGFDYLGTVKADSLHSLSCFSERQNGYCVIYAGELMIHGETQSRIYAFDGTRYKQRSSSLSEPHPKFGP